MKKFNAFDPILIRIHSEDEWTADFYDRFNSKDAEHWTITGNIIADENILPYNDNTKHLLGTENDYIEWEPEPNTVIAVRHNEKHNWKYRKFVYKDANKYACIIEDNENEIHLWDFATSIEETLKD